MNLKEAYYNNPKRWRQILTAVTFILGICLTAIIITNARHKKNIQDGRAIPVLSIEPDRVQDAASSLPDIWEAHDTPDVDLQPLLKDEFRDTAIMAYPARLSADEMDSLMAMETETAAYSWGTLGDTKGIRVFTDDGKAYFVPLGESAFYFLLTTEEGRSALWLAVFTLLFILFLLTWRRTKVLMRPRKERVIEKTIIEPDCLALHESDISKYSNLKYTDTLKDKYGFYGEERSFEWIDWAYHQIDDILLISRDKKEKMLDLLQNGYILTLIEFDYMIEAYRYMSITYDDIYKHIGQLRRSAEMESMPSSNDPITDFFIETSPEEDEHARR